MKLITLFFNSMRMTNKIDCRRFGVDPAYQRTLESELFGDTESRRPARAKAGERAPHESLWRLA